MIQQDKQSLVIPLNKFMIQISGEFHFKKLSNVSVRYHASPISTKFHPLKFIITIGPRKNAGNINHELLNLK